MVQSLTRFVMTEVSGCEVRNMPEGNFSAMPISRRKRRFRQRCAGYLSVTTWSRSQAGGRSSTGNDCAAALQEVPPEGPTTLFGFWVDAIASTLGASFVSSTAVGVAKEKFFEPI
jgi:hypothetical protein